MELKNRIVMAPMNVVRMAEIDGEWGERVQEYYAARVRGGVGLITTGLVFVSQKLEPSSRHLLNLYSDRHLESLHKIIEEAHQYDARLSVQLTAGYGRVLPIRFLDPAIVPVSPSPMPCFFEPGKITQAITTEEAEELVQAFGAAAKRCQMVGAGAVELHGHEGYLLDQFMSELWNRRVDKYGGSRQKRLTFAREAIAAIKREVGAKLPIIYRFGINHYLEGGRTPDESL